MKKKYNLNKILRTPSKILLKLDYYSPTKLGTIIHKTSCYPTGYIILQKFTKQGIVYRPKIGYYQLTEKGKDLRDAMQKIKEALNNENTHKT